MDVNVFTGFVIASSPNPARIVAAICEGKVGRCPFRQMKGAFERRMNPKIPFERLKSFD